MEIKLSFTTRVILLAILGIAFFLAVTYLATVTFASESAVIKVARIESNPQGTLIETDGNETYFVANAKNIRIDPGKMYAIKYNPNYNVITSAKEYFVVSIPD